MVAVPNVLHQASAAFPYVEVKLLDDRPERSLRACRLGDFGIAFLQTPASVAEVSARRAVDAGAGDQFKLIWQLRGCTRYEDVNRVLDLSPGDLVVTAGARDHRLDMAEGHEALVLAFNPLAEPEWPRLIGEALETRTGANAGTETAAAGLRALVGRGANDNSGELAARAMVDLALRSAGQSHDTHCPPEPPLLGRASLTILRNIGDRNFGPDRLAQELAMSRRTLYSRLLQIGVTPAELIRRVRLDRVRQDIVRDPGRSLLDIALANGFAGSSSPSKAFRSAYGQAPRELRHTRQASLLDP